MYRCTVSGFWEAWLKIAHRAEKYIFLRGKVLLNSSGTADTVQKKKKKIKMAFFCLILKMFLEGRVDASAQLKGTWMLEHHVREKYKLLGKSCVFKFLRAMLI